MVLRREITWVVTEEGHRDIAEVRAALGDGYNADVALLQELMSGYFSGDEGCTTRQGKTISPLGATSDGGKLLKVRWMMPGCGKSGGLRFAFVAYCERRTVVLCRGWVRKEDPDDADFDAAGQLAADQLAASDGDDEDG
ncbi:MAG TPA: hypothetical protein VF713_24585 [Thermoanaerobaculia bacterium]